MDSRPYCLTAEWADYLVMRLLLNCISSCFRIYWALIVLWSRVWPFGVWRHCMQGC